ncbi:hypothetical protein GW17_00042217 [Ensete ventricosum]|nr:hypothetical protein GW17_00042217 [Ensete ventricosum]
MGGGGGEGEGRVQNVLVMRHGDRIDHLEPLWVAHASRPWDPPLAEGGLIRAWTTGKRLRGVGFPIHRVLVSPFLRCLETATEVIRALCCVVDDDDDDTRLLAMGTSQDAVLDPSRVKVRHQILSLFPFLWLVSHRIERSPKNFCLRDFTGL